MNYIAQINAFQDWAQINSPSTAQVAMWYALMDINNRCGWKEWFSAPYSMIEVRTGISRSGITKTRKSLVDAGLIEVRNQGGSSAALYKVILLGSQIVATNVSTNVSSSEIVVTNGSSEWPQMGHIPKDIITTTITTDNEFAKVNKAYGQIHGKFDIEPINLPLLTKLLQEGISGDLMIQVMMEKHAEKTRKGEKVSSFSYYEEIIRDRHKLLTEETVVPFRERGGRQNDGSREVRKRGMGEYDHLSI